MFLFKGPRSVVTRTVLAFGAIAYSVLLLAAFNDPESYELPFGENPYLPSRALSESRRFLKPEDFPTAEFCSACHQSVHKQWRESAHANSFRTPFYVKNVNLLISQKGIAYTRHCEGCHNPIALFTGALSKNSTIDRKFDDDGVTCMVCHSIARIQDTSGVGSYVMGLPAVMLTEDGKPRTSGVTYDDIVARPDLHKRAVMKDFYRTPEFCAACHKAAIPHVLNDYKWLRAFSVYDEWQQSSWSKESPLPFYKKPERSICQTCHMPLIDDSSDAASKNGKLISHRWLGANTSIPLVYGYKEQLDQVERFLRDSILGIDLFSVTRLSRGKQSFIAPRDRSTFSVAPGDILIFDTVIQNKKIGHSLVPEQRDFYECWVELKITDAAGNVLLHSGSLDGKGFLDPNAHSYTNRLVSSQGDLLVRHEVWQTKGRGYDNTILPGRSDVVRYRFVVPEEARGDLTVTAKVNYRRFRQGYTNWIMEGKPFDLPVIELASLSVPLKVGLNRALPVGHADDRTRWNNYGIALLDSQEYEAALNAFQKVVALDPSKSDGFTNVGIVEFISGNYDAALFWLRKALSRDPNDLRAVFYEGMTLRWQHQYAAATERFRRVIAAYPRLRTVRLELGYVYLLQKEYAAAREQYEAAQAIDPDDLLAHRYLGAIYRELKMPEAADRESQYIADKKDDPDAAMLVQNYWRKNLGIAREVLPYHVHGEIPEEQEKKVQKILNLQNPPSPIWIYR